MSDEVFFCAVEHSNNIKYMKHLLLFGRMGVSMLLYSHAILCRKKLICTMTGESVYSYTHARFTFSYAFLVSVVLHEPWQFFVESI